MMQQHLAVIPMSNMSIIDATEFVEICDEIMELLELIPAVDIKQQGKDPKYYMELLEKLKNSLDDKYQYENNRRQK